MLTAIALGWSYIAQWTTFDCSGDVCTYERRRLLTFPMPTRRVMSRKEIGAHPDWLELRAVDGSRGSSDIVLHFDDGPETGLVYQGWREEAAVKVEELRRATKSGTTPIRESVSPHPFGFVVLALVFVFLFVMLGKRLFARAR